MSEQTSRRGFRDGLLLARDAARELGRRPKLTLAAGLLATASFLCLAIVLEWYASHLAGVPETTRQSSGAQASAVVARFAYPYEENPWYTLVSEPAWYYTQPLYPCAIVGLYATMPLLWFTAEPEGRPFPASLFQLATTGAVAAGVIFYAMLVVGLLGWVRDGDRSLRLRAWPGYWRRHVWPVTAVTMILGGCASGTGIAALLLARASSPLHPLADAIALYVVGEVGTVVVLVVLMPAPFAVVARGLGARGGIVTGWRLVRDNWPAMLALFIVFYVGFGLLSVWKALAPWVLDEQMVRFGIGAQALLWFWVRYVGVAMLGLWMAYAFMEIAKGAESATRET